MKFVRGFCAVVATALAGLFVLAPMASADTDTDAYSISSSPGSVAAGSATTFRVSLTNAASNADDIGLATVAAPAGFQVTGASSTSGRTSVSGNVVTVRDFNLAPGATGNLMVTATAPCADSTSPWSSTATEPDGETVPLTGSNPSTTVTGACGLAFVTEPHSADIGQPITGTDYDTSGPPVTVEIVGGGGNPITSSTAAVTLVIGTNPGAGTLSGTTTVNAVGGVATFSNLSIDKPANGYTLTASSSGLTGTTSTAFDEQNTSVFCAANSGCQSDVGTAAGDTLVVVGTAPDPATLTESVDADAGVQLVCPGHKLYDPDTYEFDVSNSDRSKVITTTLQQPLFPLLGTLSAILGDAQYCFGATYDFIARGGKLAPPATLPTGVSGFIGLLPNCKTPGATVCVASRSTKLDLLSPLGFDVVITVDIPAGLTGDPIGRL